MNSVAREYISKLQMQPHPEGGYYKEVYRSDESLDAVYLPARYGKQHVFATSIYFMLEGNQIPAGNWFGAELKDKSLFALVDIRFRPGLILKILKSGIEIIY